MSNTAVISSIVELMLLLIRIANINISPARPQRHFPLFLLFTVRRLFVLLPLHVMCMYVRCYNVEFRGFLFFTKCFILLTEAQSCSVE